MHTSPAETSLSSQQMLRRVNVLRRTDNVTNWFYLAREYVFLGIVINLTIAFYQGQPLWGVSWLWDVEFKLLAGLPIVTAGTRGWDMANRLKYDELKTEPVESSLKGLVDKVMHNTGGGNTSIIFATYTAMLALRKVIGRQAKLEKV